MWGLMSQDDSERTPSTTMPRSRVPHGHVQRAHSFINKVHTQGVQSPREEEEGRERTSDGVTESHMPSEAGSTCPPGPAYLTIADGPIGDGGLCALVALSNGRDASGDAGLSPSAGRCVPLLGQPAVEFEDGTVRRRADTAAVGRASTKSPASRKVSFAEVMYAEAVLEEPDVGAGSPAAEERAGPIKVPLPAYGTAPMAPPNTWMPLKKRPIFKGATCWNSQIAAQLYRDEPIHKRPSGFLLAEPPRMFV